MIVKFSGQIEIENSTLGDLFSNLKVEPLVNGEATESKPAKRGRPKKAKAPTEASVKKRLTELVEQEGPAAAQEVLTRFDAAKFSQLDKERWGEFVAAIDEVMEAA